MKYRIRNTDLDEVVGRAAKIFLNPDGLIEGCSAPGNIYKNYKAEMEVAPGFYVGDYVLCFDDHKNPYIYLIEDVHTLKSIDNDYSDTLLNVGALVRVYEVIKCL